MLALPVKVCLCGDGAVGKTSLRERYLGRGFSDSYLMTIGADFALKELTIAGYDLHFQIWDLAGQSNFRKVRSLYYRGAKGLLFVFDVTRMDTFESILGWVDEIKKVVVNTVDVPIILIGNKVDLRDPAEPHITTEQGLKLAKVLAEQFNGGEREVQYIETSAKTGENVEVGFTRLAEEIVDANT